MILKGSQRAGGRQLAAHLLKTEENEHVEVHELRGFVADTLKGALDEAHAVSRGTRCKQFMFSLSLSPPETESVPVDVFEKAIADIETHLGLADHPRAIVFHEKEGRRHAHCVWSRIDTETMTAVNLSHFKLKLRDISRQLYMDYGWKMPGGLVNSEERDPLNFSRAEWQQAKRAKLDPRALKEMFQECWASSDSRRAFAAALATRGYHLAQGDRRGHVAVDYHGEIYAIAKWTGVRTKEVKARLGAPDELPTVAETKAQIAATMTDTIRRHIDTAEQELATRTAALNVRREKLAAIHRKARADLKARQDERWIAESKERSDRFARGFRGLWQRLTGKHAKIKRENEAETERATKRDRAEHQTLIDRQLAERRRLQQEIRQARRVHVTELTRLQLDIAGYATMWPADEEAPVERHRKLRHGPSLG